MTYGITSWCDVERRQPDITSEEKEIQLAVGSDSAPESQSVTVTVQPTCRVVENSKASSCGLFAPRPFRETLKTWALRGGSLKGGRRILDVRQRNVQVKQSYQEAASRAGAQRAKGSLFERLRLFAAPFRRPKEALRRLLRGA